MRDDKLLKKVLDATTRGDIAALLELIPVTSHEEYFLDHKGNPVGEWVKGNLHWLPVGRDRGNGGRIKLAGNPMNPIAERLVNAMEALIELFRLRELASNPAAEQPESPRDAVLRYFGLPSLDSIWRIGDKEKRNHLIRVVKEVRELVEVRLARAGSKKKFAVTVRDQGMGQSPELIHQTLLSLGQTDKADKPYMIGLFGQGGSSAYAASEVSTVISRRAADILTSEESGDLGWTVVKQIFPKGRRDPYFAYLAATPSGEVPRFSARVANQVGFNHGSRFRHIDYDFGSPSAEISRLLYQGLNHVLFNPMLPYNLFALRDTPDPMQGTGQRLARQTALIQARSNTPQRQPVLDKIFPTQPIGEIR